MLIIPGIIASSYPAVSNSYESISSATGTGSSGTITFSSIPSTYKHLQIRIFSTNSAGSYTLLRANSDSASNYNYHQLYGTGATANAAGGSFTGVFVNQFGADINYPGIAIVDILDYADTNKYKTVRALSGFDKNGSGEIILRSGLWRNTAAISTLDIILDSGNYSTNTKFALYGVKG